MEQQKNCYGLEKRKYPKITSKLTTIYLSKKQVAQLNGRGKQIELQLLKQFQK